MDAAPILLGRLRSLSCTDIKEETRRDGHGQVQSTLADKNLGTTICDQNDKVKKPFLEHDGHEHTGQDAIVKS